MIPYGLILNWFLGGGWIKCLEGLAVAAAIAWGALWLHNYHVLQAKAALADGLTAQLSDEHSRLDKALGAQKDAERDRDEARKVLAMSDADRAAYFAMLAKRMPANAPIRTNPLCLPSDDDRRLRNEATAKFVPGFGSTGIGGGLPAIAK